MDLSPFLGADDLIAVHVRERTIAGGTPGVVTRYVLELEWANRDPTLLEQAVPEDQTFNLASFEAFIRDLNRALAKRRG
jgi:hypothetical protein